MKCVFKIAVGVSVLVAGCKDARDEIITSNWNDGSKRTSLEVYKGTVVSPDSAWHRVYYPGISAIYMEGLVVDQRRKGTWTSYYRSGKKQCKTAWVNGFKEGGYEGFYESGQLEQKGKFVADEFVEVQFYDKHGNEKSHNADLSFLLKESPTPWRDDELQNVKNDCLVEMETVIANANMFCACFALLLSENCQYDDVKTLTPNQRANLALKLMEVDSACLQYYR